MAINYDKLWGILNERGMMKTELIREAKSVQMRWLSLVEMKMFVWRFWLRYVKRWIVK